MHAIEQLFNNDFAKKYLQKKAPKFAKEHDLCGLTITAIKRNVGKNFYHVVMRFDAKSLKNKPIFCTSHSQENRENAYRALVFIKNQNFGEKDLFLPEPLFFDRAMNAFFYQGIDGENLLHYIQKPGYDVAPHLEQSARWIASLHEIPTGKAKNFNPENSRIKTAVPGPDKFLPKIKKLFPETYEEIKSNFEKLTQEEEAAMTNLDRQCLIHGDFHPENVIISSADKKMSVIDFTDACLSDWTRDVGNMIQQLQFMSLGNRKNEQVEELKNIFLSAYLNKRNVKTDKDAERRIIMYQSWTALRSGIYFLTKIPAEKKEARTALDMAKKHIKTLQYENSISL